MYKSRFSVNEEPKISVFLNDIISHVITQDDQPRAVAPQTLIGQAGSK
jgi:hypothetical protein